MMTVMVTRVAGSITSCVDGVLPAWLVDGAVISPTSADKETALREVVPQPVWDESLAPPTSHRFPLNLCTPVSE